ncbi:MAG: NADH-quinone oxidoreductase subunit N [Thermodesulfobacteriota bacterium]
MIDVVFTGDEARALAPLLVVLVVAMAGLLVEAFAADQGEEPYRPVWFSLAGVAGGILATVLLWDNAHSAFQGTFALDGVAAFTNVVCLLAAAASILTAPAYLANLGVRAREFYPLVLFAASGMMVMGAARDLIVLFLGLEIMSIAAYVLAGIHRTDRASGEAALKYFLLGAFATGFLLYGIAVFYGVTGSTSYAAIAAALPNASRFVVLGGVALLIVALGFKVSAVPFHFWAPDVYQGAPTSVTALMAVGIKAAAVAGFARLFITAFAALHADWAMVVWWLSVLTMTVGNVVAIAQSNVKRMLAYSSIAHAGYLLAAIVAGTPRGGGAVLFYLLAYAFMNLGAFAVVIAIGVKGEPNEQFSDYAGLASRHPLIASAMTLFMLSLTGIPPLVGFVGKLYLIEAIVDAGYIWLAVIMVLNSAVSAYYYLRVIIEMFMRDAEKPPVAIEPAPFLVACLLLATVGTIFFGLFPDGPLDFARESFRALQ